MIKIRAYIFPLLQVVSLIGISICSLWFSSWYSKGENEYIKFANISIQNNSTPVTKATFWNVIDHNYNDFKKPVPYTGIVLIIAFFGTLGGFRNQYKINLYDKLESSYREEKLNHGETQKNYYEAIGYIIRLIFVSTNGDYGNNCRVTIYRHTNDSHFKRIYRHASQTRYEHGGRLLIPDNEGVVGAAWLNDGIAFISIKHKFGSDRYKIQLNKELQEHGSNSPITLTSMPTKNYFAMAIRDLSKNKMAVIVLESTSHNTFDRVALEKIIQQENSDIAKYIIHKGKLDEILNPDGGTGNV